VLFTVIKKFRDGDPRPGELERYLELEVIPIITSEKAVAKIAPHL
jgi:hypothetical protein